MNLSLNQETRDGTGEAHSPGNRWRVQAAAAAVLLAALLLAGLPFDLASGEGQAVEQETSFSFIVAGDQRFFTGPGEYDSPTYFRGAIEAAQDAGAGAFLISPGDLDPVEDSLWTIRSVLGQDYRWIPVVGNHELPGRGEEASPGANMDRLRNYDYGTVNPGPPGCPETTFSFDYGDAHFVVLNEYCNENGDTELTISDVSDHLYAWLENDLAATDKTHIFAAGHAPAFVLPDADNGRIRHVNESLDRYPKRRDRFWNLLREEGVLLYMAGHTHNYSLEQIDGVWQLDAGHARGAGDTGADSTFIKINVSGGIVSYETYRTVTDGGEYELRYSGLLTTGNTTFDYSLYLPFTAGGR